MADPLPYQSRVSSAPPPNITAAPVISPEHLQQLAEARQRIKPIRRAISVAKGDAWMIAVFGAITLVSGYSSPAALALGAGMGVIAWVEFKGTAGLKRLNPAAARWLGWNQLAFAGLIIAYALWQLHASQNGGELAKEFEEHPELKEALGDDLKDLTRTIGTAVYGSLIAVAIFAQGGLALYYFGRAKHVRRYVEGTPGWAVELMANDER